MPGCVLALYEGGYSGKHLFDRRGLLLHSLLLTGLASAPALGGAHQRIEEPFRLLGMSISVTAQLTNESRCLSRLCLSLEFSRFLFHVIRATRDSISFMNIRDTKAK